MGYTEVSAKTIDEAITKACVDLGLSSDQLEIEVVNEGSSGFLGLGAKPAVIRVRKKEEGIEASAQSADASAMEADKQDTSGTAAADLSEMGVRTDVSAEAQTDENNAAAASEKSRPERTKRPEREKFDRTDEEIVTMKASASKFLESVFGAMKMPVNITMEYDADEDVLNVDFAGEDMGILIGKRGQTLDSLQYLTSLVVNRDQKNFVRIKLDTEDYRRRRKETLENLAGNIARKVRKTQRAVTLEPMNPYERRIIHSYLQGTRGVETYSEGNEPYRHVVVTPKDED